MSEYSIGIDFGTTKTLVAYVSEDGAKPEIAHLGRERNSIPTTAYVSEVGLWEFGDDADDHAAETHLYIRNFKLSLGSRTPVIQSFSHKGYVSYTAKEVTAKYLEYVRHLCESEVFNGHQVTSAAITHPVDFSRAQVEELRQAAMQAGFTQIKLIREPEAAGLAFCRLCPESVFSGAALVVDWGGGTLDLALVSREGQDVHLHGQYASGVNTLGGIFFDELLLQDAEQRLLRMGNNSIQQDSLALRPMLLKRVSSVKERLSRQESVKLVLTTRSGACPALTYSRDELEKILNEHIMAGVDKAKTLLYSIKEASLRPQQVLFIGGSSQIPCIAEELSRSTGLECRRWQFSHEAVALGAAISVGGTTASISNKKEVEAAEKTVYRVMLTQTELDEGTVKTIKIDGHLIQFRSPSRAHVGMKLRLGADKTDGLGDVYILLAQAAEDDANAKAKSRSYCMQSAEYLYGINGKEYNPQMSLSLLRKGIEAGEPCCHLDLAAFYDTGVYLPFNPQKARAHQLQAVSMGSKVALAALLTSGLDEHAMPLGEGEKEKLIPGLIAELGVHNEKDDDDLRYTWISELLIDKNDFDRALSFCSMIKDDGLRKVFEALTIGLKGVFRYADESLSESERRSSLLNGVQALQLFVDNPCCLTGVCAHLLSDLYSNEDGPVYNMSKAQKCLNLAKEYGDTECYIRSLIQDLNQRQYSEDESKQFIEKIDHFVQFGHNGKADDDCLNGVNIELRRPDIGSLHKILPDTPVREELSRDNNVLNSLYGVLGPEIDIENTTNYTMTGLVLSMRCEQGIFTYNISQLAAGETLSFDPGLRELESWPSIPDTAELEVCLGSKHRFCKVTETYKNMMSPQNLCPLLVTWKVSFFGGKKLCVQNLSDQSLKCLVQKVKNNAGANIIIGSGEIKEVGWTEFADDCGVELDEAVLFRTDEYCPMIGLVSGESDETAGWLKAAGWIGGAVAFALGGS